MLKAFSLAQWIEENRHLLKPPVGNKVIWKDHEFICMAVGGPNSRTDFHVNQGEEFFYQIEGDMHLKIMSPTEGLTKVPIRQGEIFLLPANTPHSPQRPENSVGLVIERRRREGELDGLQWYCEQCHKKLYEEFFVLTNIETQFPAVFEKYYNSNYPTCKSCNHVNGRKWTLNDQD